MATTTPKKSPQKKPQEISVVIKTVPFKSEAHRQECLDIRARCIARALKKLHHRTVDVGIAHTDGDVGTLQAAGMVARNVGLAARGRLA